MIISHEYRYVFVQLPHTACTAVGKELCEHYAGEKILWKHSTYREFLRVATDAERDYYVFSSIRNPLEVALTKYFKYRNQTGGGENFELDRTHKRRGGWVSSADLRRYRWVSGHPDASFAQFARRFHRLPYDNWSALDHAGFDRVIRYESLEEDFSAVLRDLGVTRVRELPVHFATDRKDDDLDRQFTPEVRAHAAGIFGPFMQQWGYDFPGGWNVDIPRWRSAQFAALSVPRRWYWAYWKTPRGRKPAFLTEPTRKTKWTRNDLAF